MDRINIQNKITTLLQKYKYVLLILCIGLVFLLLPIKSSSTIENSVITNETVNILSVEDQLSLILSEVKGAGKVHVMLSTATGEEILYQTDEDETINENSSSARKDTVTITDADRSQSGLIRQVNPPIYLGAIVVCQGADDPTVKFLVTDAVSKVTGLGTDKISVLKMK